MKNCKECVQCEMFSKEHAFCSLYERWFDFDRATYCDHYHYDHYGVAEKEIEVEHE